MPQTHLVDMPEGGPDIRDVSSAAQPCGRTGSLKPNHQHRIEQRVENILDPSSTLNLRTQELVGQENTKED
jgi:hypothetical protein